MTTEPFICLCSESKEWPVFAPAPFRPDLYWSYGWLQSTQDQTFFFGLAFSKPVFFLSQIFFKIYFMDVLSWNNVEVDRFTWVSGFSMPLLNGASAFYVGLPFILTTVLWAPLVLQANVQPNDISVQLTAVCHTLIRTNSCNRVANTSAERNPFISCFLTVWRPPLVLSNDLWLSKVFFNLFIALSVRFSFSYLLSQCPWTYLSPVSRSPISKQM